MNHGRTKSIGQQMHRWDQSAWERAASNHAMYKRWIGLDLLADKARQRIAELETKYPALKSA